MSEIAKNMLPVISWLCMLLNNEFRAALSKDIAVLLKEDWVWRAILLIDLVWSSSLMPRVCSNIRKVSKPLDSVLSDKVVVEALSNSCCS